MPKITRRDVLIGEISVSFVRYLQCMERYRDLGQHEKLQEARTAFSRSVRDYGDYADSPLLESIPEAQETISPQSSYHPSQVPIPTIPLSLIPLPGSHPSSPRSRLQPPPFFTDKVFRGHVENVREIIGPAVERYCRDLFYFLGREMFDAGFLKRKCSPANQDDGGFSSTIPAESRVAMEWLGKKLREWEAPIPHP